MANSGLNCNTHCWALGKYASSIWFATGKKNRQFGQCPNSVQIKFLN